MSKTKNELFEEQDVLTLESVGELTDGDGEEMENSTLEAEAPVNAEVGVDIASPAPKQRKKRKSSANSEVTADVMDKQTMSSAPAEPILTVDKDDEFVTDEDRMDLAWHEILNSHITGRILTGTIGMVETLENGNSLVVVFYKGMRVALPASEMMMNLRRPDNETDERYNTRMQMVLSKMVGAEIDFIVSGLEKKTKVAVASRRRAMLKKRKTFFFNKDLDGLPKIYPGRQVEARIVGVGSMAIRVEVFGLEASVNRSHLGRNLGDARDMFNVGDTTRVKVSSVRGETPETLVVELDMRTFIDEKQLEALKMIKLQSKCVGNIIDVRKGVCIVRLLNGALGIAHTCLDKMLPGKGDDVVFVVTRIDDSEGVCVGLISRIIKQNL